MSVPEGPQGSPDRLIHTSVSGVDNATTVTDRSLEDLAAALNTLPTGAGNARDSNRWRAIKHLRVLRLKWNNLPHAKVAQIQQPYRDTWVEGTLAAVARQLNVARLSALHLNGDWFAPSGVNWWVVDPTGQLERSLTSALLRLLEDSTDLPGNSPVEPLLWTWKGNANQANYPALLNNWPAPENNLTVIITWERHAAPWTLFDTNIVRTATDITLQIHTPMQTRTTWL